MTETLQRKFVKPKSISDSLKCIVCSETFVKPTRLFCSHTFCYQCIQGIMKANANCPMCRTKIDKKNWGSDRIAQNIIDQLQVFCPVEDCPWKGINKDLQNHYENECQMKHIVTDSGKSHKKTKQFNMSMLQDDQVQQKINQNQVKGCLQARLQLAMRKDNKRQSNEGISNTTNVYKNKKGKKQSQSQQQKKNEQENKSKGNLQFFEQLFFS